MSQHGSVAPGTAAGETLAGLGEAGILRSVFRRFGAATAGTENVLVGPGDDTALLATPGGQVLATTDTMVQDRDWRPDWSSGRDVGVKVVYQNLADLAAMGGAGTGLLVTLVAPGEMPVTWVEDLTAGIAEAAEAARVPVIGGDLSSSSGAVAVSVTALGQLPGAGPPVLRSGARPGQLLAVSGTLGRSAAGLALLRRGHRSEDGPGGDLIGYHRRPQPDLGAGPVAAAAGAGAMIDVSDGLVRDGGRVAAASQVVLELDPVAVSGLAQLLADGLGAVSEDPGEVSDLALECVLRGGEEHILLATFDTGAVPTGWTVLGQVRQADSGATGATGTPGATGVAWHGELLTGGGWDHFGG